MSEFHLTLLLFVVFAIGELAWRRWRGARVSQPLLAGASPNETAPHYRTLASAMAGPDNLLLLRLLAASLVIYAHSYAIDANPDNGDVITRSGIGVYAGSIAVYMFFAISGFLVTGSWQRQPSLGAFLLARGLRIVPAFALCLAGCALLLGPAVTSLDPGTYYAHPDTWRYITKNLQFEPNRMVWTLPGVFEGHTRTSVNGSLWTLPAEVRVYAWLAIFGVLGLLSRPLLTLLALIPLVAYAHLRPDDLFLMPLKPYLPMAACFVLGALAWIGRKRLPLNLWVLLGLIVLAACMRNTAFYLYAFLPALTYGCFWFAYAPLRLDAFNRLGDYSYGLYLWGFPLQQTAVHLFDNPSPMQISLFAWPTAMLCAIVSWHLVEKPALALRHRSRARRADMPDNAAAATASR